MNLRPPEPHSGALPDCATSRRERMSPLLPASRPCQRFLAFRLAHGLESPVNPARPHDPDSFPRRPHRRHRLCRRPARTPAPGERPDHPLPGPLPGKARKPLLGRPPQLPDRPGRHDRPPRPARRPARLPRSLLPRPLHAPRRPQLRRHGPGRGRDLRLGLRRSRRSAHHLPGRPGPRHPRPLQAPALPARGGPGPDPQRHPPSPTCARP